MRVTLYVLGAILELSGILFLAAPDLVPGAIRLSHWTGTHWRPIENRIRRLLHLPGRSIVINAEAAGVSILAGRVSAVKSVSADADIEQRVAFLLQRDQEAQRDLNLLAERLVDAEEKSERRLGELRGAMEAHVGHALTAAQEDYRTARGIGTIALILGLAMTTTANFI